MMREPQIKEFLINLLGYFNQPLPAGQARR